MKLKDLGYTGVFIRASLLTEKDWIKLKKTFIKNNSYNDSNTIINLYSNNNKLIYIDGASRVVSKFITITQFRNLFSKIKNKLK